jgi:hypothetical protein
MTLAAFALALRVMIPAGFMAAPTADAGLGLVLCTGHGPLTLPAGDAPDPGKNTPAGKAGHDTPCVFAGHGAGAPAPDLQPVATVVLAPAADPAPAAFEALSPGRGLAAPPPPSRGPPTALT